MLQQLQPNLEKESDEWEELEKKYFIEMHPLK